MPKKNSAKKSKSKQENPDVVEQKKPTSAVKETGNEIDEVFSGKKRKTPQQESPNVEEGKPAPAVKKSSNEIDEIFAGKKKKKPKQEQPEKGTEDVNSVAKKKKKTIERDEAGGFSDQSSRSRKRTEDGLTIYTEEELGIGKSDAGGTPLCPFDCSCCF